MFSNKIDTYAPVKDDKLKSQSNQNFDFEGEGFSSMLEQDEVVSGKLRETDAELLEDESILSTDEENLAMVKKAKEYKSLSDDDFSHNGEQDMELLTEIISINNQSGIEVNSEYKAKNAESVLSQAIEESKKKLVRLNLSELTSEDVDYIINLLQNGTADSDFDNEENPSALSAKFLAALKDSIVNKKVFRIDFDNEISVIIKIDTEGKISANFLTSSKELGEGLKNNLYILRQRFEEQGIKYGSIDYTASENEAELDMQEIVNIIQTADTKEKTTH